MFLLEIIKLGLSNLRRHFLRSFLTALGIILGVAAVITNAAIGEGSKRQALLQLERLGAKNIIIRSVPPPESASANQQRSFVSRFGLTRLDLKHLTDEYGPYAEHIVPLKSVGGQVINGALIRTSQAFGTTPDLVRAINLRVARGRYLTSTDMDTKAPVCVIGAEVARLLFPFEDPLESTLRIDAKAYNIIGILEPVGVAAGRGSNLVGRDLNADVHIPLTTAEEQFGDLTIRRGSGNTQAQQVEVSEVYLVVPDRDQVLAYAARVRQLLNTRRPGLPDVAISVPLELLQEAQRAAFTWNLVLIAIAGISLLVGGIGIMNIMLASVTERTREIGIRRALGATRRHIVWQFLVETGVLSAVGGMVGVGFGVFLSFFLQYVVPRLSQIPGLSAYVQADAALPTAITFWSVGVAFFVATGTGLLFGIYPALRASKQDPIVALRHD
ncbi:MAG: ABC transporter ATP-binding protein [Planctomyces sp.]|nr:ABC transporter ATP-binding protein [Planctomyces sp.]MBA4119960.1 ABC transporter ATP-binding protein [Isosphaera sp.]